MSLRLVSCPALTWDGSDLANPVSWAVTRRFPRWRLQAAVRYFVQAHMSSQPLHALAGMRTVGADRDTVGG